MIINDLLKEGCTYLKDVGEGGLAAEVLLCEILGWSKEKLFINGSENINDSDKEKYFELLKRHLFGEPVAYLIGKKEFYGLEFFVDKRVLIPRPETEILVERSLDFINGTNGKIRFLEVGTGSGCISCAVAKNCGKNVEFVASEVSDDALAVAKLNAEKLGLSDKISFVQSDLLDKIEGTFDLIVANLPYIGTDKFNFVSKEAKEYEPNIALFGGQNGLFLYEKMFKQIVNSGLNPKLIMGEFGFLQFEAMEELLGRYFPINSFKIVKDLALIERVFVIDLAANK